MMPCSISSTWATRLISLKTVRECIYGSTLQQLRLPRPETFRLSIKDSHYQQVFVAACGVVKYMDLLTEQPDCNDRLTLLLGTTVDSSILQMRQKAMAFPQVFGLGLRPNRMVTYQFSICWNFQLVCDGSVRHVVFDHCSYRLA